MIGGDVRRVIMRKLKKAPLVIGTTIVGIVALLSVRKRQSKNTEAEPQESKQTDPETATENAKAAVEHARKAAEKTKKSLPRTAK